MKEKYSLEEVKKVIKIHWMMENGFMDESELHSIDVTDDFEVVVVFKSQVNG
jgi:hypothetical protein